MTVVTRFAPSPTGNLHLGSFRTALFSYLHARHHGGKFLLRIEDTDQQRSTLESTNVIFDTMKWIGLDYDGEAASQRSRQDRHVEIANELVRIGAAYRCGLSLEEANALKINGVAFRSPWRESTAATEHSVIRLKVPDEEEIVVNDLIKGPVTFKTKELDDFVLLRSDGTPTYNLAVVVDDHDMGVTTIIRGDDHMANTPRQMIIYNAMGWDVPEFAHIPLILGGKGKLSKRDGAVGVPEFRELGYLPEALENYLCRLGWGHDNDEIFSRAEAIAWFDVAQAVSSPSRMDMKKLDSVNQHYIQKASIHRLADLVREALSKRGIEAPLDRLANAIPLVRQGAVTIEKLADAVAFIFTEISLDPRTKFSLFESDDSDETRARMVRLRAVLRAIPHWGVDTLNQTIRTFADIENVKMGKIGPIVRGCLTGTQVAPDLGTLLVCLGRAELLRRLETDMNISRELA